MLARDSSLEKMKLSHRKLAILRRQAQCHHDRALARTQLSSDVALTIVIGPCMRENFRHLSNDGDRSSSDLAKMEMPNGHKHGCSAVELSQVLAECPAGSHGQTEPLEQDCLNQQPASSNVVERLISPAPLRQPPEAQDSSKAANTRKVLCDCYECHAAETPKTKPSHCETDTSVRLENVELKRSSKSSRGCHALYC